MTAANDLTMRRALEAAGLELIEEKRCWSRGTPQKGNSANINQMIPALAALETGLSPLRA
jgi:hypothetical protein